jgi:hypothetical protein
MEPQKEFAFSARFAAAMSGLPLPAAHRGIQVLVGLKVIRQEGTCPGSFGRDTYTYFPGEDSTA